MINTTQLQQKQLNMKNSHSNKRPQVWGSLACIFAALAGTVNAIDLQVGDQESVCNAATDLVNGIMDYYLGIRYGGTVGMFQQPYYWWESGLAFGSLVDTWKFCDNDTYVSIIQDAFQHQKGADNNFNGVANQSDVEANDDQLFWGFTAMEAAERNFPPYADESDENPSYAQIALNTYNSMAPRWDANNCDGGLRWQILSNMSGWDYKSTISTAGVYALAGRLARYTGDDEFVKSASRVLRWMKQSNFVMLSDDGTYYSVHDGAEIVDGNCPVVNGAIWSYNYATMMMGTVYLYSATNDDSWADELGKFLSGVEHYMVNTTGGNVLYEYQCEQFGSCNNDQRAFRAIVARVLGKIVQLAPNTDYAQRAMTLINESAQGAAASCSGGSDGVTCGMNWGINGWDGLYGLGEEISALEIIQNTLIEQVDAPCKEDTCGAQVDTNNLETIPVPTSTRYFTDVSTQVETSTATVSSVAEVFYSAKATTTSS